MFIKNKLFLIYLFNILIFFIGLFANNTIIKLISFLFIMILSKKIKKIILNHYNQIDNIKDINNQKIEIITI